MKSFIHFLAVGFLAVGSLVHAGEGGISGGGGGSLPANPAEPKHIVEAILESKALLRVFLQGVEMNFILDKANPSLSTSFYEDFAPFFSGTQDVFTVLDHVQLQILEDAPCLDFNASPVDASINTSIENGICMSVARLSTKLSEDSYKSEITALMLHELSHLFGTNESQAVQMQKISIRFFKGQSASDIGDWAYRISRLSSDLTSQALKISLAILNNQTPSCDQLDVLQHQSWHLNDLARGGPGFLLVRESELETYWQLTRQLGAIRDFICSLPASGAEDFVQQRKAQNIEIGFAGSERVEADIYQKRILRTNDGYNRFPLVTTWIDRMHTTQDAKIQINQITKTLEKLGEIYMFYVQDKFSVSSN